MLRDFADTWYVSERPGDHRLPWIRRPRGALPVTGVNLRVWLVLACVEIGFFGYGVNGLRNDWGLASSLGALVSRDSRNCPGAVMKSAR
jgi:hypothetical protein